MNNYALPKKEEIIEILSKFSSYKIINEKVTIDGALFNKNIFNFLNKQNSIFSTGVTRGAIYATVTVMVIERVIINSPSFNEYYTKIPNLNPDNVISFLKEKQIIDDKQALTYSKNSKNKISEYLQDYLDIFYYNRPELKNSKKILFMGSNTDYKKLSKILINNIIDTYYEIEKFRKIKLTTPPMAFHFIWIGKKPNKDLLESILAKMRYLNTIFSGNNNVFNFWTTKELQSTIKYMLALDNFSTSKVKVKIIDDDIFNSKNAAELSKNNVKLSFIQSLYIKESNGILANYALASDVLKILILYFYDGIYMDSGLDIKKNPNVVNMHEKLISKYLPFYDIGFTAIMPNARKYHTNYDIQVLYSKDSAKSKEFYLKILKEFSPSNVEQFTKKIDKQREDRLKPDLESKQASWSGQIIVNHMYKLIPEYRGQIIDTSIKYFLFRVLNTGDFVNNESNIFADFPRISLKNDKLQKYDNYRSVDYRKKEKVLV